jgi:hypothetical protein
MKDRREISRSAALCSDAGSKDRPAESCEVSCRRSDSRANHDPHRTETGSRPATNGVTAGRLIDDHLADYSPVGCASVLDLGTLGITGQCEDVDAAALSVGQLNGAVQ